MLKIADLREDEVLLEKAKKVADELIEQHPAAVQKHLARWMGQVQELVKV